ncbi:hypothetical protein SAMN05192558_113212 [Actinokineospora alba]|uniref:Excreted virulence factor EspC, type VII ESX diderm n=1 Tax=Actinokineospora alba TaxID=504798 RepID=A0A1H0VDS7_9PSEU|nr:hypothetical protein [Actinokineospora alba]TDP65659.1 hypothetical protein C8E96_1146 [Actinokineospora alba]SDH67710.1 hypothetical protein SAMN05421871_101966 [Actinokineospora alba]SDP76503.1 hypothetical protein SAMN05192558_113212 [Actinokineospora alba]
MGEQFKVEPEQLRGYAGLLGRNAGHFKTIEDHARSKGGDTSGFTGLLSLLVPVVDGVVGLYGETLQFANDKLGNVQSSLESAAAAYETADRTSCGRMTTVDGQRSAAASGVPTVGAR